MEIVVLVLVLVLVLTYILYLVPSSLSYKHLEYPHTLPPAGNLWFPWGKKHPINLFLGLWGLFGEYFTSNMLNSQFAFYKHLEYPHTLHTSQPPSCSSVAPHSGHVAAIALFLSCLITKFSTLPDLL